MTESIDKRIKQGDLKGAAALISHAIEGGKDLQGKGIFYSHILALAADWRGINSLLPAGTNSFQTTGWINSLAAGRPLNESNDPIPWFTYPAIDFLDTIIKSDWKVLEWGSGNSTLWWAKKVSSITAVEDNADWHKEIRDQMPDNVNLLLKTSESEYVQAPKSSEEGKFGAIVIDGSHRSKCAVVALEMLDDKGVIIFDNSDGVDHQEGQSLLREAGLYRIDFWGLIPSYLYKNCTSIYLSDPSLLQANPLPHEHMSSVGRSCQQSIDRLTGKI